MFPVFLVGQVSSNNYCAAFEQCLDIVNDYDDNVAATRV